MLAPEAISIFVLTLACTLFPVHGTIPDGYLINQLNGHAYKLVYQARPWNDAKSHCESEGAKLAVPKSEEEFTFLQQIVRGMHYPSIIGSKNKLLVWLGINNLEDYKVWKNIDGENIEDTGFHKWASEHNGVPYSSDPKEPHCVGMDAVNPGLRDYWCHRYQPFICELQLNVI